jgi:hypothetical protein
MSRPLAPPSICSMKAIVACFNPSLQASPGWARGSLFNGLRRPRARSPFCPYVSCVEILEKSVDDPLNLSNLLKIITQFSDSIKLVEKKKAPVAIRKTEEITNVARGRPQEPRHQPVEPKRALFMVRPELERLVLLCGLLAGSICQSSL